MPVIVLKNKDEIVITKKAHQILADKLCNTGLKQFVTLVADDDVLITLQVSEISHIKT